MTKTELVIVPTPGMGHLLSTVDFAKLIVRTNLNISIVVLIYHIEINESTKIQSYIDSQSLEVDPTQIVFITLPPLSNPPDSSDPNFLGTVILRQNSLVKKAVQEIADGLDRSGHRFLWSLRKPVLVSRNGGLPSEHMIFDDALPEGFIDRTAHIGKIIPWAPQVAVLAHQAIGGFISHCGWNSILESIWFGVSLATWPMYAEQQLNAFTLVKELGLAVEIKIDYRWDMKKQKGNYLVKAEEVEAGVRKLMSMDNEMKAKVREMNELSRKVLQANGGSSHDSLIRFLAEINEVSS